MSNNGATGFGGKKTKTGIQHQSKTSNHWKDFLFALIVDVKSRLIILHIIKAKVLG